MWLMVTKDQMGLLYGKIRKFWIYFLKKIYTGFLIYVRVPYYMYARESNYPINGKQLSNNVKNGFFGSNLQIYCIFSAKVWYWKRFALILQKICKNPITMTALFSPFVCREQIADALCVSVRTVTRMVAPLRKELGLRQNQSLTKKQVEEYFGDQLKNPLWWG